MTLVILLLALLALVVGSRSEPLALVASPERDEAAARAQAAPEERHDTDDGLTPQPSLSRPGVASGKARPAMTSIAQMRRSPWQGDAAAPNLPNTKGLMAIDARIPSGVLIARAQKRAS